jgi:predicted nucleotidyltransferase
MQKILDQITQDARTAMGENLVAVILYGSHARGEAVKGSDINLLLIVRESHADKLTPLMKVVPGWISTGATAPVIFERDQLSRAADTFALELAEIAATHRLLWGEDPFAGYTPDWTAVRRELEHESRQKVIFLERRWLASGGQEAALRALIRDTVPGFLALLRGTILQRRRNLNTVTLDHLFTDMEAYCDWFQPDIWQRLRAVSRGLEIVPARELDTLVKTYLEQARSFVRYIDQIPDDV